MLGQLLGRWLLCLCVVFLSLPEVDVSSAAGEHEWRVPHSIIWIPHKERSCPLSDVQSQRKTHKVIHRSEPPCIQGSTETVVHVEVSTHWHIWLCTAESFGWSKKGKAYSELPPESRHQLLWDSLVTSSESELWLFSILFHVPVQVSVNPESPYWEVSGWQDKVMEGTKFALKVKSKSSIPIHSKGEVISKQTSLESGFCNESVKVLNKKEVTKHIFHHNGRSGNKSSSNLCDFRIQDLVKTLPICSLCDFFSCNSVSVCTNQSAGNQATPLPPMASKESLVLQTFGRQSLNYIVDLPVNMFSFLQVVANRHNPSAST